MFRRPFGVAGGQERAAPGRLADAGILQRHPARGLVRRLAGAHPGPRRARRDAAIGLLRQGPKLLRRDIAGDHQDGVVGHVPPPVKGHQIGDRQAADLVLPPDDRPAVGVVEIERRVDVLGKKGGGIVAGAVAALLEYDLPFRLHLLGVEHQVGHAVGFHLHDHFQAVHGDALVVAGVIVGREGVLAPAVAGEDSGELPRRQFPGALEHQVLEEMGDARLARRLVGRTHLVPDHVGDHGDPVVGDDHNGHAVLQGEGFGIENTGPGGAFGSRRQKQQGQGAGRRPCPSQSNSHGSSVWWRAGHLARLN